MARGCTGRVSAAASLSGAGEPQEHGRCSRAAHGDLMPTSRGASAQHGGKPGAQVGLSPAQRGFVTLEKGSGSAVLGSAVFSDSSTWSEPFFPPDVSSMQSMRVEVKTFTPGTLHTSE